MERLRGVLARYNEPLTKEQLEKIIYNIFCIVIFITPIISDTIGFGIYSLKSTILNFTTIITSIALFITNRKNLKLNVYDSLLIIYLFLVVLSTAFTEYGISACILGKNGRGEGTLTIFSYVATFVIFSRGYKYMTKFSKIAIIAAIITGIYSVIQANVPEGVKIPLLPKSPLNIARGTMRNQNFLSSYVCIFLPMICFYYINGITKLKRTIAVAVLLFLTLVYAKTLGGYITFVFMYILITIFSIILSKKTKETLIRIITLSLVLMSAFAIVNIIGDSKYAKELSASREEVNNLVNNNDDFGSGRMEIWKKSFNIVLNHPLLGVGPDSMARELRDERYITKGDEDMLHRIRVDKAHSEPLHIAVTTGIPSALLYLALAIIISIRLFRLVIKNINKKGMNKDVIFITMVFISLVSYLMQSMINISVIQVAPMFWAVFGTAAGIIQNSEISTR